MALTWTPPTEATKAHYYGLGLHVPPGYIEATGGKQRYVVRSLGHGVHHLWIGPAGELAKITITGRVFHTVGEAMDIAAELERDDAAR